MISVKSRDLAYSAYPIVGRPSSNADAGRLVGDIVTAGELWACTTCGACEEACPVFIEYVDKIVDMRRHLVDEGNVPATLQKPMADLEKRGNPYGKMPRSRDEWANADEGGEPVVRTLKPGDSAGTLFFTDSCAAYDPRIQTISRTMGRLMQVAGEDCGTLGKDEVDSGHEVRRFGEEGLFEALRDQNLDAMEQRSFDRVMTTDPHAMNALRNDGYDLGKPVVHHTEVLAELIRTGRLTLQGRTDGRTYTFHDPCYLGRHNGVYDAPREVLAAVPGLKTVEMERSRNRSFCCGGGSLYLFHEGESESRMGEKRLDMAEAAGADVVITACPFCTINLEDAVKTSGREGKMEVMDLVELVARFVREA
jgi:Fe-S oxidoreductase